MAEAPEAQRERIWRVLAQEGKAMTAATIARRVWLLEDDVFRGLGELIREGRATNSRGWYRATGHGADG